LVFIINNIVGANEMKYIIILDVMFPAQRKWHWFWFWGFGSVAVWDRILSLSELVVD